MIKKALLPTNTKKTKATAKKAAPKKAASTKTVSKAAYPKYTVKPMPNTDSHVIYEGDKQTNFINSQERCQTQADFLNSK